MSGRQETIEMTNQTDSEAHLITPMKIENLAKKFKTHRCVLDFDKNFIKATSIQDSQYVYINVISLVKN
jgi:hypothetical protein